MSTRKKTPTVSVGRTPRKSISARESISGSDDKFPLWEGVKTRHEFALKEEEIREWMEQLTNLQISTASRDQFESALSDARILCIVMKVLVPESIPEIPDDAESRAEAFLAECERVGVAKQQLFLPADLLEKRNMVSVIYCLHELARLCHERQLAPFFTGSVVERAQAREEWANLGGDIRPLGAALLVAQPPSKGAVDVPSLRSQIDLQISALEVAQRLHTVRETLASPTKAPSPVRQSPRRPELPSIMEGVPARRGFSDVLGRYPASLLLAYVICALVWWWLFALSRVPLRLPG
eukprot:TRINITY_DN14475_c0_g1_i1.p1 TRINITY_DN14475_c0_g1~~TRINITY_DN14475_c0_g1_i1.p1  ORF type:complete len:295 (-),score=57.71 TRINITY_DN14475_c0_g1_i1:321-1205(-)